MFGEANKLLPEMQISGAGITEVEQQISQNLPETMTKDQVANLLVQILKGLTLGER